MPLYNYQQMMDRVQFLERETRRLNDSGMMSHATLLLVHCAYLITFRTRRSDELTHV